jgi:hypothetical protein
MKKQLSSLAEKIIAEQLSASKQYAINKYLDPNFKEQNEFIKDKNRFVAAQCSRRAGKSNGLALRFLAQMEKHPGAFFPYIALTRESARNIMWPVMQEQDEKYEIGCEFTEFNLSITHPNGARLQLFGADTKNFIRRLKGIKTPGAAIDEAQDFGSHIVTLVDDVLTPTLTDYDDSWLAITGTPGPIPRGFFYEITHEGKHGFSVHKWTLLNNPYLPNANQFIEDLKKKKSWDETNPTLQREWRNNWVLDLDTLWIKWNEDLNDYKTLPPEKYIYILGVDIGLKDADALAVLAWSEKSPIIYLVEEELNRGQDITQLSNRINSMMNKYDISKIVMDEGALGKKIAEELRRRKQIPVTAADKARKQENAAFLNDYLRQGKFKAQKTSQFVEDSMRVQIDWERSTPDRIAIRDNYHSDIIDAVLYAFKESPAYTWSPEVKVAKYGEPDWLSEEKRRIEEEANSYWEKLEDV